MKYLWHYKGSIAWIAIVLYLLLSPSDNIPQINSIFLFAGVDKIIHLGIFFILALALYTETAIHTNWKHNKLKVVTFIMLSTVLFAFMTEEAQRYVIGRSTDIRDALADCLGIAMASVTYLLLYRNRR